MREFNDHELKVLRNVGKGTLVFKRAVAGMLAFVALLAMMGLVRTSWSEGKSISLAVFLAIHMSVNLYTCVAFIIFGRVVHVSSSGALTETEFNHRLRKALVALQIFLYFSVFGVLKKQLDEGMWTVELAGLALPLIVAGLHYYLRQPRFAKVPMDYASASGKETEIVLHI